MDISKLVGPQLLEQKYKITSDENVFSVLSNKDRYKMKIYIVYELINLCLALILPKVYFKMYYKMNEHPYLI